MSSLEENNLFRKYPKDDETVKVSERVNFENIVSHQTIKIKTVKVLRIILYN